MNKDMLNIKVEIDGQTQVSEEPWDWASFMFEIGRQCTMYNQKPWKEPLKDKTPWLTMKQNNITMERIHEDLENCYDQYIAYLDENNKTEN